MASFACCRSSAYSAQHALFVARTDGLLLLVALEERAVERGLSLGVCRCLWDGLEKSLKHWSPLIVWLSSRRCFTTLSHRRV